MALAAVLSSSPVSAELLLEENFNSGTVQSAWTGMYPTAANYTPNTAQSPIIDDPTSSGKGKVLHYYTLSGTNEVIANQVLMDSAEVSALFGEEPAEVYLEWQEWFDGDYCFPTGSQKMSRLYYYHEDNPESRKEYGVFAGSNDNITGNNNLSVGNFCGFSGDTSACDLGESLNSDDAHELEEWITWGLHVKLNTPGVSDGLVVLYKNGTSYLSHLNFQPRGTDTRGMNGLWVGGNYTMNGGGTAPCSGSRYIDNIKIYDAAPSATPTPEPTPTPTPAPAAGAPCPWVF